MLTDRTLKKESGQYDCECILRLKLEKKGLRDVSVLNGCSNLVQLSLARNELRHTRGLESLLALHTLDLSFNRIDQTAALSTLVSLKSLDLRSNLIPKLSCLQDFQPLVVLCTLHLRECEGEDSNRLLVLRTLHLRGCEGEDSNPVCLLPEYIKTVMKLMPELTVLDGGHLDVFEAFDDLEGSMEFIKKNSGSKSPPLPTEPWFHSADLMVENYQNIPKNGIGGLEKVVGTITEMLEVDCNFILKKGETALQKAKRTK